MSRASWRLALPAVLTAVTLGVAGCGDSGASGGGQPGTPPAGAVAAPVAANADAVPERLRFDGRTLDGTAFSGADLAGRPVLLWFWAPWCASCAGQASSVQDVATEYGSRVAVLGVAGLGDVAAMRQFVTDTEVGGVTHLNDQTGAVWRRFNITEQSVYVLLDAKGAVVHSGWLDSQQLPERVKALAD